MLGELALIRAGQAQAFPASKKARALLAYLALTGRAHRRERLCEMFWDVPDDPRASLRWALTKLRPLLNDAARERLTADRERVCLTLDAGDLDLTMIRARLADASAPLDPQALTRIADQLQLPLLDGLDMPQLDLWQTWLTAMRAEVQGMLTGVLQRLTVLSDPAQAARWAGAWIDADPYSRNAHAHLVSALRALGRAEEAARIDLNFRAMSAEAGLPADPDPTPPPRDAAEQAMPAGSPEPEAHQTIAFCTASDGVRLAHASTGTGRPLLKAANWLNHLEYDWQSPIWAGTFRRLAARRRFVRYDSRGNGMSDWDATEIGLDGFVRDLSAVADAAGLGRFPLLGMSQGCATSIRYAVENPSRVSALILIGGYATGWRIGASPEERERREAVMTLTRLGWGTSNPAYRHIFSQTFMPDAPADKLAWFDEFQRLTTSAENAVRFQDAFGDIDVRPLLSQVRVPTLVLHARDDQRISLAQGRELAIGIPGARLVTLESRNHILLGDEPAWDVAMTEIERFLDGLEL